MRDTVPLGSLEAAKCRRRPDGIWAVCGGLQALCGSPGKRNPNGSVNTLGGGMYALLEGLSPEAGNSILTSASLGQFILDDGNTWWGLGALDTVPAVVPSVLLPR